MPVYVTFNGKYTDEQYLWLIKAIGAISALKGFSGLIVADVAMLLALSRMKYNKAIFHRPPNTFITLCMGHIAANSASFEKFVELAFLISYFFDTIVQICSYWPF